VSKHSNGKWIHAERRLAIYLRDGLACVWCGATLESGARLTLDHLKCRENGGSHHESNLITACLICNSRRGSRSVPQFALAVAGYVNHGVSAGAIVREIRNRVRRTLAPHRAEAKTMIARRGTAARVLEEMTA
jgi:hypothetical protein